MNTIVLDRFRSLSQTRQMWVIGGAAAAIAVVLIMVWLMWLRTTYAPLFTKLREGDAAVIVAELDRRKVSYRLAEGGTAILVPEGQVDSVRLNVLTGDLPLKGAVGFELFNKSDMGLSDFAQRINYQRALQGELARTIMTLDGVETARVHLSLGEDRIFRDDRVPPKASVAIRMKGGLRLSARAAQGIARLIAAAVPKLDVANVVVLDEAGQIVLAPASSAAVLAADKASPATQKAHAIEQYYAARVREALERTHLRGSFAVLVSAEMPMDQAGGTQASTSLAAWNPEAREFPLRVTVSAMTPAGSETQDSLRSVVATALGTSLPSDVVTFDMTPATEVPQADTGQAIQAAAIGGRPVLEASLPEPEFDWLAQTGLSLMVLLGMLGGFFLVARQLRGARPLTERQRSDFASRLRAAIEPGDDGAPSRS